MKTRALLILTAFTAAGLALLIGLGVWQLQRLHWKEGLIAEIEARTKAPPISLDEAMARAATGANIEYTRVAATGHFDHGKERYLYATDDGAVGWHVITPLIASTGEAVLVDRGLVPDTLRDPAMRKDGEPSGDVTVTGLARATEIQGSFVPNNDPNRNRWFWRDLAGMAASMGVEGKVAPFFLDAERSEGGAAWPQGGQTRLDIPNDHLQYAITWFLLALALLVIYAVYVRSRFRDSGGGEVAGEGGES